MGTASSPAWSRQPTIRRHSPRFNDAGFMCGMEFESVGQERDHFAERGLALDMVEPRVVLGPGQLLLLDNLATARGRLGLRKRLELH
jgi:hypothetical protein